MTREEEREAIRLGVESIERSVGTRPLGWYCREMSVNTRELIVEEGGFLYDSECYNDDLPYWTTVHGQAAPRRAVPARRQRRPLRARAGLREPRALLRVREGDDRPAARRRRRLRADDVDRAALRASRGQPARSDALARFIDYAQGFDDVWFARRIDIATCFAEQVPA